MACRAPSRHRPGLQLLQLLLSSWPSRRRNSGPPSRPLLRSQPHLCHPLRQQPLSIRIHREQRRAATRFRRQPFPLTALQMCRCARLFKRSTRGSKPPIRASTHFCLLWRRTAKTWRRHWGRRHHTSTTWTLMSRNAHPRTQIRPAFLPEISVLSVCRNCTRWRARKTACPCRAQHPHHPPSCSSRQGKFQTHRIRALLAARPQNTLAPPELRKAGRAACPYPRTYSVVRQLHPAQSTGLILDSTVRPLQAAVRKTRSKCVRLLSRSGTLRWTTLLFAPPPCQCQPQTTVLCRCPPAHIHRSLPSSGTVHLRLILVVLGTSTRQRGTRAASRTGKATRTHVIAARTTARTWCTAAAAYRAESATCQTVWAQDLMQASTAMAPRWRETTWQACLFRDAKAQNAAQAHVPTCIHRGLLCCMKAPCPDSSPGAAQACAWMHETLSRDDICAVCV